LLSPILPALLGAAAMAIFAIGLWLPAYLRHRALRERLAGFVYAGTAAGFAIDVGGRRRRAMVRRARVRRQPIARFITRKIAQSQADVSPGEVVAAMSVLGILAFVIGSAISGSVLAGAAAGAGGAALPVLWLELLHRRVSGRFTGQLLDTVLLLASSVRGGHSLLQSLEQVATQAPEPTRSAFALVVREIGLGASQEDALERLADRFPSEDLELIVSAINVHQQIGGSLARVLDAIAQTIRERQRIAGDIRSFTAQQRYSAYVLSALPLAALGVLVLVSPDYVQVMFEAGTLRDALLGAVGAVVVGFFVMRRLAAIDV
jgi:tight adherence protein B